MLPQLSGIPLQTTDASSDSSRNLNTLLPVGRNVSATVVAISKDQVQPEMFRLKLEINNRLIQMGVFQALPTGQKINVNRQSDGQIQITLPQPANTPTKTDTATTSTAKDSILQTLKLSALTIENSAKLPIDIKTNAAVISSRPIFNTATTVQFSPSNNQTTLLPSIPPAETGNSQLTNTSILNSLLSGTGLTTGVTIPTGNTTTQHTLPNFQSQQETPPQANIATKNTAPLTEGGKQVTKDTINQAVTNIIKNNGTPTLPNQNTNTSVPVPSNTNSNLTNLTTAGARITSEPSHHVITLALTDGSKLELASSRPLTQGTQLQLIQTPHNEIQVLQIRAPQNTPVSALDTPIIQATLRNTLPSQLPTADAFQQLSHVASQAQGSQASQINSVVQSMLQLFGVRPGNPDAPTQIKQNVEFGGLTTENNLSKGLVTHPQDMKHQLQQLQKLADSLPPEQKERLEQLLQGVNSRVTSQQLHSLQQWREMPDGGFERVLQLDLPIKNGDNWENLELRLSREGGTNAAGEMVSVWRVRLHFDLEEQGGIDAEIRLTDDHEISTLFWCELKETADKLRARSDEFSVRLRQCGFDSTDISWHEGSAPEQKQTIHKQLVDIHT